MSAKAQSITTAQLAGLPAPILETASFPVVGIGASAGGLEALEQFFAATPAHTGMAFVVIQHLDPHHSSLLPEILQHATTMPVNQVSNRMPLLPDCIYVIPPDKDLSLQHGHLHLHALSEERGLHLPVNRFFKSLADDQHSRAVAIVLSGMGSDGALGLQAIKANGGLLMVQDPVTAKFDSMPRSAMDTGLADVVAPANELPRHLIDHFKYPTISASVPEPIDEKAYAPAFEKICHLLLSRSGSDFSLYKKSTVYRRIERRIGIHQLSGINAYVSYLQDNPQEIDLLFRELLIGVTHFFRDPAGWAYLEEHILPELIANSLPGTTLRAWVAGCSTGEEAYSLAILFRELVEKQKAHERVSLQIFATDLDPDAIARARQGHFPLTVAVDVLAERLSRYFIEESDGYRINKDIRQMVVFAPQNIIMDPPFTKLDIITCRNLLIYLAPELQKRLLPLFHYSLRPGGILFLGSAENITGFNDLFSPLNSKVRIFRRLPIPLKTLGIDFPVRQIIETSSKIETVGPEMNLPNLQTLADQLLLQKFSPAAVLVNEEGDVLFINGRTGKYLEPAAGKANWNIHAMAREGLRQELTLALPKALRSGEPVISKQLKVGTNGGTQFIDLTVYPVQEAGGLRGLAMLVFTDLPETPPQRTLRNGKQAGNSRIIELENALQQASEEIQSIREEMQSSHEELKSANEELQSSNEELQSMNEELTTSKEEMHSLNEELQTVNLELQSKLDELSATNSDMKNLLNSTDIATVFLDSQLCVRRFTDQATRIFKLISGDIGRALSDIVNQLDYPDLEQDAQAVLSTLVFSEKQITGKDGRWYTVKILPYRTLENVIDGVVITLIDISDSKQLEAQLREARRAGSAVTPTSKE